MTTPPQPKEPELPCFVPDEEDHLERDVPKCPNLRWEGDDVGSASTADEDQTGLPDRSMPVGRAEMNSH
jgi:hypothetical protein